MADNIFGFDLDQSWDYENGFYLTSGTKRLSKIIAHWELYKKIVNLPGHIVECGVYKGASLIRLLTYRDMIESCHSRKVLGFDVFGKFPRVDEKDDENFIERFETAGGDGIPKEELERSLNRKGFINYELVKGDVFNSIPEYISSHPELRISMLHIDVDVYKPSKFILEQLYERVVPGGLVVLDDYSTVSGETIAADEFFAQSGDQIQKLPISHIPAYVVKS